MAAQDVSPKLRRVRTAVLASPGSLVVGRLASVVALSMLLLWMRGPWVALGWGAVMGVLEAWLWSRRRVWRRLDAEGGTFEGRPDFVLTLPAVAGLYLVAAALLVRSHAPGSELAAGLIAGGVVMWGTLVAGARLRILLFFCLLLLMVIGVAGDGLIGLVPAAVGGAFICANAVMAQRHIRQVRLRLDDAVEAAERERDRAHAAEAAKSRLFAALSHEIRTPLNGLLGLAQTLARPDLPTGEREAQAKALIGSGQMLLELLNDILDLAKLDAQRVDIVRSAVVTADYFGEVATFWRPAAEARGLTLDLDLADGLPAALALDPLRVRQILYNLIGNALKFTPSGRIAVAADWDPTDDGRLTLAVTDSGIGMSAEAAARIFEPYAQAERDTSQRFGGTGLGLSVVKGLVERMGGAIGVESEPGRGSRFEVRLPVPEASAPVEAETGGLAGIRVLAADDHEVNRMVLEAMLAQLGMAVTVVDGGAAALEALSCAPFDVVLLDVNMPGLDGPATLKALRAAPGPNRRAPVLAVTGEALPGDAERFMAGGFDGHVPKPLQPAVLVGAIAAVLAEPARAA